jgi:uncharacterized protein YcaQ
MGLVSVKSGEYWYGILGVKSKERRAILRRLTERGELIAVKVDSYPGETCFIRKEDRKLLDGISELGKQDNGAAFIAALDNLTWNRGFLHKIFDFEYIWEVYKPKAQRKYGYYVLPVIFGDCFIARFEPAFDKAERALTIKNWWWENGVNPDTSIQEALKVCLSDFVTYLGVSKLQLGPMIRDESSLRWIQDVPVH